MAVFASAIVLVLLGALNASALLAARAVDRDREFRMRRALGASRLAAGRMVVVEVVLLFALAASLAVLLAPPLLRFALPLLPTEITLLKPWGADSFDWRVPAFTALLALAFALQAALWPMSRAMRAAPSSAGTAGRTSEQRHRGRSLVVAMQVGGAFAVTVVGALLVGSLLSVYGQGLSIRTDGVVVVEASLSESGGSTASERAARAAQVMDRLREVPGVRNVALVAGQALVGPAPDTAWGFFYLEEPAVPGLGLSQPYTHAVAGDYYRILQPEVVAGRAPTEGELASAAPVALVSESLARAQWPDENPIGRTLRGRDRAPFEIIGVVRDVPWISWDGHSRMAYGPYGALPGRSSTVTLFIDGGGRPGVTRDVLDALGDTTPTVGIRRAGNLIDVFVDTVRARRFRSWLFGGFAAAALLVVGVGILGLLAMSTARRTREIGIRQALGATPGSIARLFVREQMRPVFAGLAIGAIVSAWAVGFVESYLFGVTTTDARVWGAAVTLILVTAGAGALIPSLRASTTDPTIALRTE
jgi:predicted permease